MKTAILASAAAILFAVTSARAAVITQTLSTALVLPELNTNLDFNKFDSTLGTLTSVGVTVKQNLVHTGAWTSGSNSSETFALASDSQLQVSFAGSGVSTVFGKLSTGPITTSPPSNLGSFSNGSSTSSGLQTYTNSTMLTSFTGPGTIDFHLFSLDSSFNIFGSGLISISPNPLHESATIDVTYTYTPVAVPEPATLALAVMGIGGMLVRRRRLAIYG